MILDLHKLVHKYSLNIRGVLHIGAHYGEEYDTYAQLGVKDMIFFEPVPSNFKVLAERIGDSAIIHNVALGNKVGEVEMYVEDANEGQSCSVLNPVLHLQQYPHIHFNKKVTVPINKLDAYMLEPEKYNMINMDVQGYELEVLKGGTEFLHHIDYIMAEVNREEVYQDCAKIDQLIEFLSPYGFELVEVNWAGVTWGDGFFIKNNK